MRPADLIAFAWSVLRGYGSRTLLILLAITKLTPTLGAARAASVATGLYVLHNVLYAACSMIAGGVPAGLWGLHKGGKLRKVMQKGCPEHLLVPANIGKLVCEFMGWERFESGALRHAQFVRVRQDKSPAMCVHEE